MFETINFEGRRNHMNDVLQPTKRTKLKGEIYKNGYETIKQFAGDAELNYVTLSRIISGYVFPTPRMQHGLADALAITLRELRELL
jgi:hypothetical protein